MNKYLVSITFSALALGSQAGAQCPSNELTGLGAFDAFAGDEFGRSVAVDGLVAVVGSPEDDTRLGAAYIYAFDGTDWRYQGKLTASDGVSGDKFGIGVAISGETIVVGAYQPFPYADAPGKAYVFERPLSGWADATEDGVLTASDGANNDNFGYAVAIEGGTIAVGAYLDDDGGTNSGSAYAFARPLSGWGSMTESAKLSAGDANQNDQFGIAVGVSGDTIVVGADRDSDVVSQAGSAYVFVEPLPGWSNMTDTAKLTVAAPVEFDRFGLAVDIDGQTVVVGAWNDDGVAQKSGAAFVFVRPGAGWLNANETAKLTASNGVAGDHLGWSVAIDAGVIVAGAPANLFDGSGWGSAYLYLEPNMGWTSATENAQVSQSNAAHKDEFGLAVAVSGPVVNIGAHFFETAGFSNAGAAYLYGGASDCNANQTLDLCELVAGTASDTDGDGQLDECDSSSIGTNYCSTNANSTGLTASISATGSTVIADNNLNLLAVDVPPGQFGYFLMADTQGFVPLFGGSQGILCLGSPLVRFALHITQASPAGEIALSPDLTNLPQGTVFLPGEDWNFQCWFRDQNPTSTSNTTAALTISFQ